MTEETSAQARHQLSALALVTAVLDREEIEHWLFGGWAVDLWAGRVTREHQDVDLAVWQKDRSAIDAALRTAGFVGAPVEDDLLGAAYRWGDVLIELTFVTAGDGGSVCLPFPDGPVTWSAAPFGSRRPTLHGVTCSTIPRSVLRAGTARPREDADDAAKNRADLQALTGPRGSEDADALGAALDDLAARTGFSGVVRVDLPDGQRVGQAHGFADRSQRIPMRTGTVLGVASASKAFTALVVMRLVERSDLTLDTPARAVLGDDLPLVGADVTIEHLLAHRSGIGDYLDEDTLTDVADYVLPVPSHRLVRTEDFLPLLDGRAPKFAAGSAFSYCNSGFVVLALIAERVSGVGYHDLVRHEVCAPAGLVDTDFLRLDALPGRAATGYVQVEGQWRSNVLHLPVLATGDGGIHTTVADVHRFWQALFAGRIVTAETVRQMLRPRTPDAGDGRGYGLGFWLQDGCVQLEGCDAGVSLRSRHDPGGGGTGGRTWTVIANDAAGAWPLARLVASWAPGGC